MALGTEPIQLCGLHPRRIPQSIRPRIRRMRRSRSVARFAPHPNFMRRQLVLGGQRQRSGRVAPETAQNAGIRIEQPEQHAARIPMTRRKAEAVGRAIPSLAVLAVRFAIHTADERGRLRTRAECPIARLVSRGPP
jgi:alkanesulfonate monooxygenase SsuD/methylene tetrahydromethanopterin reductase-like flavin-dependent oxidoreductase (luciferase family)